MCSATIHPGTAGDLFSYLTAARLFSILTTVAARETPTQHLATLFLEQPVADWIEAKRADGMSWRAIAAELAEATDIVVSHVTIMAWAEGANA